MIPGLLLVGIGEGSLLTLLFNVLVSASPKRLAGDVGALRGVANNISNALAAALASVVAVGCCACSSPWASAGPGCRPSSRPVFLSARPIS